MAHDWITLHRLHFDTAQSKDAVLCPNVPGADFTRICIGFDLTEEGDLKDAAVNWGVMAVFPEEAPARAVFEDPQAVLPAIGETSESWHGLAIPLSHRGTVTWRGVEQTDCALRCGTADGPLMVVTSAGYRSPPTPERGRRFSIGVQAVLDFYGSVSGNYGRSAFNGGSVDGRNGFTLSFWDDTPQMIAAAYKTGVHKEQLDSHIADPMFDYSSFSRLALQASKGTWDGTAIAA